jgi:hypothetical protein
MQANRSRSLDRSGSPAVLGNQAPGANLMEAGRAERTCLLAQKFKRIGCRLCWLCMKGFPERWVIILRAVYPRRNFPHSHLVGRIGEQQLF